MTANTLTNMFHNFCINLKEIRLELKYTQEEFSEILDLDERNLRRIENLEIDDINYLTIYKISEWLSAQSEINETIESMLSIR